MLLFAVKQKIFVPFKIENVDYTKIKILLQRPGWKVGDQLKPGAQLFVYQLAMGFVINENHDLLHRSVPFPLNGIWYVLRMRVHETS